MSIAISCTCGRDLTLRDELAGKVIRCPACAGTLQVPVPAEEVVEDVVAGPPPLPSSRSQKKERAIDLEPPVRRPDRPKEPRKKKKKKSVYADYYGNENRDGAITMEEGWFGSAAAGIGGGLIMLLVGIGIVVLAVFFGGFRLMIWGIILIVIAVIALLKGLMDLY